VGRRQDDVAVLVEETIARNESLVAAFHDWLERSGDSVEPMPFALSAAEREALVEWRRGAQLSGNWNDRGSFVLLLQ
jgi:hypothetical protein